jgi:hypothetical protein
VEADGPTPPGWLAVCCRDTPDDYPIVQNGTVPLCFLGIDSVMAAADLKF